MNRQQHMTVSPDRQTRSRAQQPATLKTCTSKNHATSREQINGQPSAECVPLAAVAKQRFQDLLARNAVTEARLGNPYPLIGRLDFCLQTGELISDDEIRFIEAALKATGGKRAADNIRKIEQYLIAEQVQGFMNEERMSQKAAIDEVMRRRGCSRRHVYRALKARKGKSG
jgi:hypothetical protein